MSVECQFPDFDNVLWLWKMWPLGGSWVKGTWANLYYLCNSLWIYNHFKINASQGAYWEVEVWRVCSVCSPWLGWAWVLLPIWSAYTQHYAKHFDSHPSTQAAFPNSPNPAILHLSSYRWLVREESEAALNFWSMKNREHMWVGAQASMSGPLCSPGILNLY